MYPKEFSIVLYILLVGICAYLLCAGRISGKAFVGSLVLSAFAVALLHNLDVLQRFSVKGNGVEAIAEFEQIRKDVYAKAESVRQMTEAIADLIAENVTTSNRFGGSGDPDPIDQEIRYRDKLRKTLTDGGTSTDRINQILAPFDQWIPFDLRSALATSVIMSAQKKGWKPQQLNEFSKELSLLLEKEPHLASLDQAEQKIHNADLSSPEINLDIKRYRTFLASGGSIPPKVRE
jgi:hypothetical protein